MTDGGADGNEPAGLSMSLDDLSKKNKPQNSRKGGNNGGNRRGNINRGAFLG
jgi:hypothetical protein